MAFIDLFSTFADDYKTFRPSYPRGLFEYLASLAPGKELAWDCATGNGQAAVELADFFQAVIATDASAEQVSQGEPHARVEYRVAPAESSGIAAGTVDLVTVAQALHWFDMPRFFAETKRVCRQRGVVAVWCYALMTITPEIDALVWELYRDVLDDYWSPGRRLVEDGYRSLEFPFDEIAAPPFEMSHDWRLSQVVGYLSTWSALRKYQRDNDANPIEIIGERLLAAWGDPATSRPVVWPIHLRVGRT